MTNGERALRSMVAELAEMPARARNAVLAQLDEAQRERVGALLDEYHGDDRRVPETPATVSPALATIDPGGLPPGLSPWLAGLLGDDPAARNHSPLTPDTFDAVRACAAEFAGVLARPGDSTGAWLNDSGLNGSGLNGSGIRGFWIIRCWQAITERLALRRGIANVR